MAVSAKSDVGKTADARRRITGRGGKGPAAAPAASLDATEKRDGYARKAQRAPLDFATMTRSVPLAAVLSCYGVLDKLKRRGTRLIGTCPIHQGTNKRQFVVRGDAWHCFGDCNKGGHLLAFVAAMTDDFAVQASTSPNGSPSSLPPAQRKGDAL